MDGCYMYLLEEYLLSNYYSIHNIDSLTPHIIHAEV